VKEVVRPELIIVAMLSSPTYVRYGMGLLGTQVISKYFSQYSLGSDTTCRAGYTLVFAMHFSSFDIKPTHNHEIFIPEA